MMKRLFTYIFMLLALVGCCLGGPMEARADFAEKPIAYVVVDHSGQVDGAVYKDFRSVVKLAYYFPHYKLMDGGQAQELVVDLINRKQKLNAQNLALVAEQAKLEGVVVARVYDMAQYRLPRIDFRGDMEDLERTIAMADLMVYRKTGNKFLMKKVREDNVTTMGAADAPDYTIKWMLSRVVNTVEGREIL